MVQGHERKNSNQLGLFDDRQGFHVVDPEEILFVLDEKGKGLVLWTGIVGEGAPDRPIWQDLGDGFLEVLAHVALHHLVRFVVVVVVVVDQAIVRGGRGEDAFLVPPSEHPPGEDRGGDHESDRKGATVPKERSLPVVLALAAAVFAASAGSGLGVVPAFVVVVVVVGLADDFFYGGSTKESKGFAFDTAFGAFFVGNKIAKLAHRVCYAVIRSTPHVICFRIVGVGVFCIAGVKHGVERISSFWGEEGMDDL
mmetsp:Transcript_19348/g.39723  ORF Transcript_19348/g.39723 Transcript_19348/m.39723 type:complete len:253 (+) Transcript_19348:896-1654(+)